MRYENETEATICKWYENETEMTICKWYENETRTTNDQGKG